MSIDERIDKLTERHEALVQTIELMVIERKTLDEKWDQRMTQLASRMDTLLQIAELHQHRLDSLNDRLDTLEGNA